ncbi:MAG: UvrD-helicase domain-containing protein, partial [Clostridia bacterium]|nr:UvrD-helicase domain-containing protein [Clostridia bacterium]
MAWTDEQRAAIESRGENLLLSAAAGSGKTAVLVERVLRLIGEGADISAMLIVTFTRAAAADMRAALIRALSKAALVKARFRAQAEAAEYAGISTIHSFCTDILREHFQKAGVDPAFRVADSAEAAILMNKALDSAMNAAYEAGGDDLAALAEGRSPDQVRELVSQLYRFVLDRPESFGWLDEAVSRLERGEDIWSDVLAKAAKRRLADALALAREGVSMCQGRDYLAPYMKTAEADAALVEGFMPLGYEPLREALESPAYTRLPTLRGAKDDPDALAFRDLRDDVKKLVKRAGEKLPLPLGDALGDLAASAREVRALGDIARRLDAEFTRLKDERSLLTFADLEIRALRALEDPGVQAALRERYTHVFVDEYQDVSDIQEAVVNRIARENNLFCVGDVKQSIYRFRNAEPSLFQSRFERYGRGEGGRLVLLSRNFRSRASILGFTNAVFARAMRGGDSEITYDEAAFLRPGAAYEGPDSPVELWLIGREGAESAGDDPAAQLILDMKDAEVEALAAARRIAELVGTPTWDAKKGAFRPLKYRDFALLTRTMRDVAPLMLAVLKREGIPAYADVSGGYLDVVEVRVAVALLRLIENRHRDVEWIAVLRSPVMSLTSEELAEVRLRAPEGPYCDAVAACAAGEG